jgi:hydrogenase maturation protease
MKPTSQSDLKRRLEKAVKNKKAVVLCVGNPIRGDDGAPRLLLRKSKDSVVRMRMFDCGTSPQDYIDQVAKLHPQVVIFVNAVERSLEPGSIVLEELRSNGSTGSSLIGHKFPLAWVAVLLKVLAQQRNVIMKTYLVGIQAGSTRGRITVPVRQSVNRLLKLFAGIDSSTKAFASN